MDRYSYDRRGAKAKTFDEAKREIFNHLKKEGWDVKENLKVPHATNSDGTVRLYFKAQAVYLTTGSNPRMLGSLGDSRSIHVDLRKETGESFLKHVEKWVKE